MIIDLLILLAFFVSVWSELDSLQGYCLFDIAPIQGSQAIKTHPH